MDPSRDISSRLPACSYSYRVATAGEAFEFAPLSYRAQSYKSRPERSSPPSLTPPLPFNITLLEMFSAANLRNSDVAFFGQLAADKKQFSFGADEYGPAWTGHVRDNGGENNDCMPKSFVATLFGRQFDGAAAIMRRIAAFAIPVTARSIMERHLQAAPGAGEDASAFVFDRDAGGFVHEFAAESLNAAYQSRMLGVISVQALAEVIGTPLKFRTNMKAAQINAGDDGFYTHIPDVVNPEFAGRRPAMLAKNGTPPPPPHPHSPHFPSTLLVSPSHPLTPAHTNTSLPNND